MMFRRRVLERADFDFPVSKPLDLNKYKKIGPE
jgi:hypothetical protein